MLLKTSALLQTMFDMLGNHNVDFFMLLLVLVRNWTEADVIQWLEETVGLPEYKNLFVSNKIIGKLLPR